MAFLVASLAAVRVFQASQPRHAGKSAEDWLRQAIRDGPRPGTMAQPWDSPSFKECVTAFRTLGNPGIRHLVDTCVQQSPIYREWYNRAARNLQPVIPLPPWKEPSRFQEQFAAHALLLAIGPDAVPELIRRTRSSHPNVRASAATILGELGPGLPETQACLLGLLNDASEEVVYGALEVLWMTAPKPEVILPSIRPFLTHTNNRIRVETTYLIGCLAPVPGPDLAQLVTMLSDPSEIVRANAARAIGLSGVATETFYAPLAERLNDISPVSRYRAAEALARLYGPAVTNRNPALQEVLAGAEPSGNSYFKLAAFNAHTALGDTQWSDDSDQLFRELFASTLAYVRSEAISGLRFRRETRRTPLSPAMREILESAGQEGNGFIRHQGTRLLKSTE